jgi:hypothetical protein
MYITAVAFLGVTKYEIRHDIWSDQKSNGTPAQYKVVCLILSIFTPKFNRTFPTAEPGSRHGNWLQTGRPRGRNSSPGKVKNFHFSTSSRPALGPTQPPVQWVLRASFPGKSYRNVKLTTHLQQVPSQENVNLYIHSPICLHGILFN